MLTNKSDEKTPTDPEPKTIEVHNMDVTTVSNVCKPSIIATEAGEAKASNIGLIIKSHFPGVFRGPF